MVTVGLVITALIIGPIVEYKVGLIKKLPWLVKVFGSPHA